VTTDRKINAYLTIPSTVVFSTRHTEEARLLPSIFLAHRPFLLKARKEVSMKEVTEAGSTTWYVPMKALPLEA
jgi:hypothetical protein